MLIAIVLESYLQMCHTIAKTKRSEEIHVMWSLTSKVNGHVFKKKKQQFIGVLKIIIVRERLVCANSV